MAKINITHELTLILSAIEKFPEGATLKDIKQSIDIDIPLRTLQRRLDLLIDQGSVIPSGITKARMYQSAKPAIEATNKKPEENDPIPLSKEGRHILQQVSRPLQQRAPAGYNREFLDSYKPNITSYLTPAQKEKLAELGKTGGREQPAGTYAREILNRLLIDLSFNSSRLEGNTYSLLDTERLISYGEAADDKTATDAQMIINHKEAIEFIVESADMVGFNRYTILNLHGILAANLLPDPSAPGRLRKMAVGITNSSFIPLGIPQLIEEMFEQMLEKANQIEDPFEQAFFIMVHLPYLQPFDDVNKRVSRLAANIPFTKLNLAPLSFTDLPNDIYFKGLLGVYELNKPELLSDIFLWAYERSAARYAILRQTQTEPDPFRLRYRQEIKRAVSDIVTGRSAHKDAREVTRQQAASLPATDQQQFIAAVETELNSLHEGNIARYKIRPSEFSLWKKEWNEL